MNAAQLKLYFRQRIQVVAGGGVRQPVDARDILAALDALVDELGTGGTTPVNQAPVALWSAPAANASLTVGTATALTATATDDAGVVSVEFLRGTTSLGLATRVGQTSSYTLSYTPTAAGATTLTVRATDTAGLTGSATRAFTVVAAPVLTPTVTVSPSSLAAFTTVAGTPSASQTLTVSGENLTAGIVVTAPTNYEVSLSATTGYAATVTAPQTASTTVYVRLKGTADGTGNVTLSSTGATAKNVAVTGTVSSAEQPPFDFSTLTFTRKSKTLISDVEPAVWRVKDLDFGISSPGSELTVRSFAPPTVSAYEAEGSGWIANGAWFQDASGIYHNGTGYACSTVGGTLTRTVTASVFTLFVPTDPSLGTVRLRLVRAGNEVYNQTFNQQVATANSYAVLTATLSTAAETIVEISNVSGTITVDYLQAQVPVVATTVNPVFSAGSLVVTPSADTDLVVQLSAGAKAPWTIHMVDILSLPVVSGDGTNYAGLIVCLALDNANWFGLLYNAFSQEIKLGYSRNGVVTVSPNAYSGIAFPTRVGFSMTGTLLTLHTAAPGAVPMPVFQWEAPADAMLDKTSLYDGANAYKFAAFASVRGDSTLTVRLNKIRSGHYGCTAVADLGPVTDLDLNVLDVAGKRPFSCSLRGVYPANQSISNLLNNNASGIVWLDLATAESTSPVWTLGSLVFCDTPAGTREGEGSPAFVKDTTTGRWNNLTPHWHLADGQAPNGVGAVREAWGDTATNILTPGVYSTPSAVKILNPALPNDPTYDSYAFRHTNGKIRWGYTSQTASSGSTPYRMGFKVTETEDFQTFNYIGSNVFDGYDLGVEGIRAIKVAGRKYFLGAGHTDVFVFDGDGELVAQFPQPAEVHAGGFGSHCAMGAYQAADGFWYLLYIAFDSAQIQPGKVYSYGNIYVYLSNQRIPTPA